MAPLFPPPQLRPTNFMYLTSISSAFPGQPYSQKRVWELLSGSPAAMERVTRKGRRILQTVLNGDSGIDQRFFAIPPPEVCEMGPQRLNEEFEQHAPRLAKAALERALERANLKPVELDALFVCTCTGYLCPGVSSYLAELMDMPSATTLHDVTGLGCGAAIPTLQAASWYLAAHPGATVATVAVEVCSGAFFLCDDPGVAVSACLFGDGAAAAIWRNEAPPGSWHISNFQSRHYPSQREKIRFINDKGGLRNKLDREVPAVAAQAVSELFAARTRDPDQVLVHPGGRDVIEAIEAALPPYRVEETRRVLRSRGNLSSPSILMALEERLSKNLDDKHLWLSAFGAGFLAYCCEMERR